MGDIGKKGFFRCLKYLFVTGTENAFASGGAISTFLAYPFLRIIGTPGAQIIIICLLFLTIMRLMDLSIRQLWWYIGFPFRKLRELWNRDPEWADDIPEDAAAEEEPEFLLPEQHAPKIAKVHRRGTVQPQPEPAAAEPASDADIPDFVAADQPLPSELDDMIRNSYSQPQDDAPYTPAYDMDIDIPIPDSEPDNAAIVSPDELLQDPPELAEPAAETENPSEPAAPAAPTVPARPYQIPSIDFLQNGVSRAGDPAVDQEMKEKAGFWWTR